jgi:HD-like signal output (HDOD) protein
VPAAAARLEDMNPIITKEALLKLVNEGLKLRPLATTVQSLMSITSRAQCTADDVADAIGSDQALSIRLLKLASSTVYSRGHPVENVKDAVQRMGIMEVRNTVTTLAVMHNYEGRIADYVDPWLFWEHSLACGVLASLIAKTCHPNGKADYFLLGMLHEVGRLILIDHIPDKYAQVWEAADTTDQRLEIVEKKLLMMNHSEILERALEHWHFPQELIIPVVNHHQSVANLKRLGPAYSHDAAIVALADRIAHAMLLGSSGNDMVYPLEDVADLLGLAEEAMRTLQAEGPKQTSALKVNLLVRGNLDAWPDFGLQLKAKLVRPIRPLCVSARPHLDAYKIFCELLAENGGDEPPNVGVIYASDVRELDSLIPIYTAAEQKAGSEQFPIVIVKGKGKFNPDHAWLKSRNIVVLDAPTSMKTLINAFNRLLA